MDVFQYVYAKERRKFGRQCLFSERHQVLAHLQHQPELMDNYILENPVSRHVQKSTQMALDEMNTLNVSVKNRGVNHVEGGWPKDVNYLDEEQTLRHRKKVEREDQYVIQMNTILKPMCHAITQNNAVQIYENYFDGLNIITPYEELTARMVKCYQDPWEEGTRPANHVTFSTEYTHIAVAYADLAFQNAGKPHIPSYIWDIGNTQDPYLKLTPDAQVTHLEYSRDGRLLAGGLTNGKVCFWDVRAGGKPQVSTKTEIGHKEPVMSLLWIHSKTNSEFYSGSTDGMLYWWDTRFLEKPVEQLICDPVKTDDQSISRSYGVTALEYEYTIPTRFIVGTDEGYVFYGNRKGLTPSEKFAYKVKCTDGPICSLERNPFYSKNLLVVGDHSVGIWFEDCKDNPIMWTVSSINSLTCGTWSRQRSSLLFVGRSNGTFEAWDILVDTLNPIIRLKVSEAPICSIKSHENGECVAVSDGFGDVFMLELSEPLAVNKKNDRPFLSAMFDREVKREKILEGKIRELKLKEKQMQDAALEVKEVDHSLEEKLFMDKMTKTEIEFEEAYVEENNRRVNLWKRLNQVGVALKADENVDEEKPAVVQVRKEEEDVDDDEAEKNE